MVFPCLKSVLTSKVRAGSGFSVPRERFDHQSARESFEGVVVLGERMVRDMVRGECLATGLNMFSATFFCERFASSRS